MSQSPALPDEVYRPPTVTIEAGLLNRFRNVWLINYFHKSDERIRQIRDFSLHNDDILVASFPKSGTTWLQYVVLLVISSEASNVDDRKLSDQYAFIDVMFPSLDEYVRRPSPRLIKSHLPYELLPADVQVGKAKVLYVARNPKDVCVSFYHFTRAMQPHYGYSGQFDDYLDQFVSGRVFYGPYLDHVAGYWNRRKDNNMLFVLYEDLHKEPEKVVRQIADYLGRSLTDEQLTEVVRRSAFDVMKHNPNVNYSWLGDVGLRNKDEAEFMRKGIVGDWKNYMTDDMERKIYETCVEPLEKQGLTFTDS